MNGFESWLRAQAESRESAELVRALHDSDDGRALLDLAGNDYLGLARDPRVVEGAIAAAHAFGSGARASRLVTGTLSLHTELEHRLAEFTGFPEGLVLSTGYHANLSAVTALTDSDALLVSDAHVHASLVDACRLSRAQVDVVPHNDVLAVRDALARRRQARAVVLVESIYSVLGDRAPLSELADACAERDAVLVVDEAHALGVAGPGGRGLLAETGLAGRPDVVATGTLSKALGAQGGVVLASAAVRDQLVNRARPFIYDTGLAPPAAGAARAALEVVISEPAIVDDVRRCAQALADACGLAGPAGAVLSAPVPGPVEALQAVEEAAAEGVRIGCFRPPSTPDGTSRIRVTARAGLSGDDLALATRVLGSLAR